jgi:hypothetical protein
MVLRWYRFDRLTAARAAFKTRSCVYVQTDSRGCPVRIGKASRGLGPRYHGGTGYALDAAMHASRNRVFVAAVPAEFCDAVERTLIWRFRAQLTYNNLGLKRAPHTELPLRHSGTVPRFRSSGFTSPK